MQTATQSPSTLRRSSRSQSEALPTPDCSLAARDRAVPEDRAARPPRGDGAAARRCSRSRGATTTRCRPTRVEGLAGALRVPRLPALHRGLDPDDERAADASRLPPGGRRLRGRGRVARRGLSRGDLQPGRARAPRLHAGRRSTRASATAPMQARELHGVEVRLTPDIPRGFTMEEARATVEWAARYRDRGVVGVGLGGLEAEYPPEPYEPTCSGSRSRSGSARCRTRARSPAPRRCAARSTRSAPTGCATGSAPRRTRASCASSPTAASFSTCARSRISARAPSHSLADHPLPRARRRRRPLLDLDRRPGDVRHRSDPRLRGRDLVRPRSALVLRRRASRARSATRRPGPAFARSASHTTGNRRRHALNVRHMGLLVTRTALVAIAAALVLAAPAPADAPAFTVGESIAPSTASPGGSATITVTATNTGTDQATMYFILDLGPGEWSLGSASQLSGPPFFVQHDAVRHDMPHRHLARRRVGELQRARDRRRNGNSGHHPQLARLRVPGNGVRHRARKLCAVAHRRIGAPTPVVAAVEGGGGGSPAPPATATLTVTRGGAGSGSITSTPAGIDCGTTCSATSSRRERASR